MRRPVVSEVFLTSTLVLAALLPVPMPARATVPVVVIDGKGFGHGVGMAQEGAFWMGAAGASTEQILGQFYPGTGFGRARGPVRVPVLDAGAAPAAAVLAFPGGGEVREAKAGPPSPGFPVRVAPGGSVTVSFDGRSYRVEGGTPAVSRAARGQDASQARRERVDLAAQSVPTLPPPPDTTTTSPTTSTTAPAESTTTTTSGSSREPPPSSTTTSTAPPPPSDDSGDGEAGPTSTASLVGVAKEGATVAVPARQRQYRGFVEATAASGTLRLVNTVDVEAYLKGMGEVLDPSWPPAALRAQAIAARTYALRAMAVGGEVCDTQRCQVYLGAQAEYGAMNRAVDATREQVLVFGRGLISAVYSANGGGHSATREEGFGVVDGSIPYLRAAPYLTHDPGAWSLTVALSDVAARVGYAGEATDVRITRSGESGRAVEVTIDGTIGPKPVTGIAFDAALGLRSTLFTMRVDAGEAPPPPPADGVAAQAPPEDAAAVAAVETAGATGSTAAAGVGNGDHGRRITTVPLRRATVPEELLVVAGWVAMAVLCAIAVTFSGRRASRPSSR